MIINSVLPGFNLSILDNIHSWTSRIQFVKSQSCIFVRHMNKQLGIICIKVKFDVRVHYNSLYLFIYLGFYVAFNTVQVISQRVVGRAEETSTYSLLGFCTANCRPTASNYQLSHLRLCRKSNPGLRGGRRECYHSATVAPITITLLKAEVYKENSRGPRIKPYCTPNSSSHNSERVDPILIAWNWWLRYDVNHFKDMLHTLNHDLRQLRQDNFYYTCIFSYC